MLVEDKRSDLDALSRRHVITRTTIDEGRMRHSPGAPVRLGVKALDENDLLRSEAILEVPLVGVGVLDRKRRPVATTGVNERDGDEIILVDRVGFSHGQWVAQHRLDGAPNVDDLHPALEQLVGLVGEVVRDAAQGRFVRLVNVHAVDRAPELGGRSGIGVRAADGVVKDEDA